MYRYLFVALLVGFGMAAQSTDADARWNRRGVCKQPIEGVATGKGLFGEGTARARQAAVDNWEAEVEQQYGRAFANFDRSSRVRWDCAKNALITAKCVVIARPCSSRISG